MDAAFIRDNQIIERYLMGRLPPKGMRDFEGWCRENPETITQLGFAEQVNAALRLMESAGQPEPWTEKPQPFYQKPQKPAVVAALAGLAAVLLAMTIWLANTLGKRDEQIAALARELQALPLQAVQGTRPIVVQPSRSGALADSMFSIGGGRVELIEFKYDVGWSAYSNFRLTMDRVGQGRFAVLTNLTRDSNGQLRVAYNSSALGPGDYQVQIEGVDWRGGTAPQGWARFTVTR